MEEKSEKKVLALKTQLQQVEVEYEEKLCTVKEEVVALEERIESTVKENEKQVEEIRQTHQEQIQTLQREHKEEKLNSTDFNEK